MNGLLFITHGTDRYDYLDSVRIALEGGCRRIQLRMKDSPAESVLHTAKKAKELCSSYGAELYIDDHVDICRAVKAAGVHLGRSDMAPSEARKILGGGYIIGGTANTIEDIRRLKSEGVDYIGAGPFRFTTTKKNLSPILGLDGYKYLTSKCIEEDICLPIFAIGGITIKDIPSILGCGVSGIALSSTILTAPDPIEEMKKTINIINEYQK